MTDSGQTGHTSAVSFAAAHLEPEPSPVARGFDAVYDECFELVWRMLRRMGVPDGSLEDAVQDVFLVVHRRFDEFQRRSATKTWVAGIAIRVAADHRRLQRRKGGLEPLAPGVADRRPDPLREAVQAEAVRRLNELLQELDDERREVFVLSELEQMTAPEISEALGVNVNTVYSRLRAARKSFDEALARQRSRER